MFIGLLIVAASLAILVTRLPRGGGRAFAAGSAVLALTGAAFIMLRRGGLPGHRARRWHPPS